MSRLLDTINEHLRMAGYPEAFAHFTPGDKRIPEDKAAKHPTKYFVRFEKELGTEDSLLRRNLQEAVPGSVVTNVGVFLSSPLEANGTDPQYTTEANGKAQVYQPETLTTPKKSEYKVEKCENITPSQLETFINDEWQVFHKWGNGDALNVWFMRKQDVEPPTPAPKHEAVEVPAPSADEITIVNADDTPIGEPAETPLEKVLAEVRHAEADRWLAQRQAEREMLKTAAVLNAYDLLQFQVFEVSFGGD